MRKRLARVPAELSQRGKKELVSGGGRAFASVCNSNLPVRPSEWVGGRHKPARHKTFVRGPCD